MKKSSKILLLLIVVLSMVATLVACKTVDFTTLDAPSGFTQSGSTISWNAVSNASSYELTVDGGETLTTKETYYTLSVTEIKSYEVKIRAVGVNSKDETVYSSYASYTFTKTNKLDRTVITITDKVATWTAVQNAGSYTVKVTDTTSTAKYEDTITELSYSFDSEKYSSTGRYYIYVTANPSEDAKEYVKSDAAMAVYVKTEKLAAPAFASMTSSAIRWTAVSNASSYVVKLYKVGTPNDELVNTYTTSTSSYLISNLDLDEEGTYYCLVQSKGDTGSYAVYQDSDFCERNLEYDIKTVNVLDGVDLIIAKDAEGLSTARFTINKIDSIESLTLYLKAKNASGTSSLTDLKKTVALSDGVVGNYIMVDKASQSFDSSKVYYVYDNGNYIIAKKVTYAIATTYSSNLTYYKQNLDESYSQWGDHYYLTDDSTVNIQSKYYTYDSGTQLYTAVEVMKEVDGNVDGSTTIYALDGGVYVAAGTKDAPDAAYASVTHYYQALTAFESGTDYYEFFKLSTSFSNGTFKDEQGNAMNVYTRSESTLSDYEDGVTYYLPESITFTINIEDLFFEKNGDVYDYLLSDLTYYGKFFDLSLSVNTTSTSVVNMSSISKTDGYVSYRIPHIVGSTEQYSNYKVNDKVTVLGQYFDSEEEFNSFKTKYNGYYVIQTIGELQYLNVKNDINCVLVDDLDNEGFNWNTIKKVNGIVDGNNHYITNLVYYCPTNGLDIFNDYHEYCASFVKLNNGTIKDLYLTSVSSDSETAIVAGFVEDNKGTINNCLVQGKISASYEAAGFALENSASIASCQVFADVKAPLASGFVQYIDNGTVSNSYVIGDISANIEYVKVGDYASLAKLDSNDLIFVKKNDVMTYLGELGDDLKYGLEGDKLVDSEYEEFYTTYNKEAVAEGFAESVYNGTISNCFFQGNVSANGSVVYEGENCIQGSSVAGFISAVNENSTVENCYAGPKFTKNNTNINKATATGGKQSIAAGFVSYMSDDTSLVTNCYTTLEATAGTKYAGFAFLVSGKISNSYALGGVGNQTSGDRAAFVISISDESNPTNNIENCYFYIESSTKYSQDAYAQKLNSLSELVTTMSALGDGKIYASIPDYLEPVLVNLPYANSYEVSIRSGEWFDESTKIYIAYLDGSTVKTVSVKDLVFDDSDPDVFRFHVGDFKSKGNSIRVISYKGIRYAIYLTTK